MKIADTHSWFSKSIVLLALILFGAAEVSMAQYFSFGKNRVQYNTFDWRYIQSEHFDVHYYGSLNYELADFTVRTLESSLKQFTEDYNHQIADRIKVIIYDSHNDFSQTNVVNLPTNAEGIGGVTDAYKNRITMPFSGNYTEFRSTLHHELSHAVFNDMFYGGSVQSIVNNNIQLTFPNWFDEGLAEYVSVGWDSNTDMWIRDAVINNYLPDLPQLSGYFAYRGGQSLWNFIVEEYGREKIGEILQTIKTQRSVEVGFQRALGLSIPELSERWKDYYRKRYLPEVAEREDIDNFATLVTDDDRSGTYNTSPALSPQGDKIAMITNKRGYFDVVVISAITGEKLKTLIKGNDNVNFEELNILNPNLSWSPDGEKLTLSAKSKGSDDLAIVDYRTGEIQKVKFPRLDAIGSVAWSPDGTKIAFDGNIGPYQDIFVYNLETQEFLNITNDIISDFEPAWSADSKSVYFVSARGSRVELNRYKENASLLLSDDLYSTDIYEVELGSSRATRLTKTPNWSERQPMTTREGEMVFISDQNGIPNVYQLNLEDRTSAPLTNLQSGVMQISLSSDGSRMAVNSVNEGNLDIYLIRSPFLRKKDGPLAPNEWAERRQREPVTQRVPATLYVRQMFGASVDATAAGREGALPSDIAEQQRQAGTETGEEEAARDTLTAETAENIEPGEARQDTTEDEEIDFRNYVFATEVEQDTAFANEYLNAQLFNPENNTTRDGRYQPREYRLRFTTDFAYAGGSFSTYYGSYGLTQVVFSDLLGDHQITFGSNLVFDLRNSDYFLSYGYYKQRTNWLVSFSHSATSYQTYSGQLYRFRTMGGGITAQYPIDKFRRLDLSLSGISIARDYTVVGYDFSQNEGSSFLYPQATYTVDRTLPGFITPVGGHRYAFSLSGSPPAGSLEFVSLMGDYRKYFNLGYGYSVALRGSGALSYGPDSQTYFMGGMLGWINQRWSGNSIPTDKLADTFFTIPALPLRGHEYNSLYGDRFSLINAEFRFPLFAAILPGPIPILPLYNMTGAAFIDAGAAWGQDIPLELQNQQGGSSQRVLNDAELDFAVSEPIQYYLNRSTGDLTTEPPSEGGNYSTFESLQGDVLIGAGFGIRTILLGLPFRYDIGWPYYRDGFGGDPIHYFSIGIDF
ncbi:peptidase MA family metallohydrolase [Halalkalibaculum sp. DA384]|uniref:peptidase MA family metallohydrolase n=1 Tax=Halalkalibaculum sp. DA384 TaxID=3373606 RepID=UPI0037546EE2